jgi:hypothetical protein
VLEESQAQTAEGQPIRYNFVKPHMALEGQTPAQAAGMNGQITWMELLKKSLEQKKSV